MWRPSDFHCQGHSQIGKMGLNTMSSSIHIAHVYNGMCINIFFRIKYITSTFCTCTNLMVFNLFFFCCCSFRFTVISFSQPRKGQTHLSQRRCRWMKEEDVFFSRWPQRNGKSLSLMQNVLVYLVLYGCFRK